MLPVNYPPPPPSLGPTAPPLLEAARKAGRSPRLRTDRPSSFTKPADGSHPSTLPEFSFSTARFIHRDSVIVQSDQRLTPSTTLTLAQSGDFSTAVTSARWAAAFYLGCRALQLPRGPP